LISKDVDIFLLLYNQRLTGFSDPKNTPNRAIGEEEEQVLGVREPLMRYMPRHTRATQLSKSRKF